MKLLRCNSSLVDECLDLRPLSWGRQNVILSSPIYATRQWGLSRWSYRKGNFLYHGKEWLMKNYLWPVNSVDFAESKKIIEGWPGSLLPVSSWHSGNIYVLHTRDCWFKYHFLQNYLTNSVDCTEYNFEKLKYLDILLEMSALRITLSLHTCLSAGGWKLLSEYWQNFHDLETPRSFRQSLLNYSSPPALSLHPIRLHW